ncbi:MAG: ISAzo13 family transposase [Blautia sp.]|nr:ISAzo13 family transposase [Blautia sp.]
MLALPAAFTMHIINNLKGMSEKQRRLYLGSIAIDLGYGGVTALSRTLNISRGCIHRGIDAVKAGEVFHVGDRSRVPGGGRKRLEVKHREAILAMGCFTDEQIPEVVDILFVVDTIVMNASYGDPMRNNAWINVTVKSIGEEIYKTTRQRYSHTSIKNIVRKLGYSLQKNQKYDQVGDAHPMRDAQFNHIEARRNEYIKNGDPVISIDTKAKEKLGDFIRSGVEYRKKGDPRRVLDHDFAFTYEQIYPDGYSSIPAEILKRKAIFIPYGIYCLNNNTGYAVIGIDHDTSEFAADSIAAWWKNQGSGQFPNAKRILILADGGGSNRSRGWVWKIALQQLSDNLGIKVEMCHYPPGTSKYNPIERRLWSQVSHAWTAKPLTSLEVVKGYTCQTHTKTGLTVGCEINFNIYLTESEKKKAIAENRDYIGIINDALYQNDVNIQTIGDCTSMQNWNYVITPHSPGSRWKDYRLLA